VGGTGRKHKPQTQKKDIRLCRAHSKRYNNKKKKTKKNKTNAIPSVESKSVSPTGHRHEGTRRGGDAGRGACIDRALLKNIRVEVRG